MVSEIDCGMSPNLREECWIFNKIRMINSKEALCSRNQECLGEEDDVRKRYVPAAPILTPLPAH